MPKYSPWGAVQHHTEIAPGIVRLSTASHGGYHCTGAAQRAIAQAVPAFVPWAGRGWYEEDEDWMVVVLIHAEHFEDAAVESAARWVQNPIAPSRRFDPVRAWLQGMSPEANVVRKRAFAYAAIHAEEYDVVSWGSPPPGYPPNATSVGLRHRTTKQYRQAIFATVPTQGLYTSAEIDALDLLPR